MTLKQVLFAVVSAGLALSVGAGPKFVALGWEFAKCGPKELIANADKLDRTALDGVAVLGTFRDAQGNACDARSVMETGPWTKESAKEMLPYLRQFKDHPSLRHSLLSSFRHPTKRIAWTDDAGWARVASNMRLLAALARAAGVLGLYADEEDYAKQRQFVVTAADRGTYDELAALARRRGAETFRGVFEAYPTVRVLFLRLLTSGHGFWSAYYAAPDPLAEARRMGDLWPSFVNGILDVIPPTAFLADGDESSYYYEGGEFYRAHVNVKSRLSRLLAPENRAKYLNQVQMASSVYLDMYAVVDEKNVFYRGPVNGSRAAHLDRNLNLASEVSEEIVWFWGEQRAWIDWTDVPLKRAILKDKTWGEAAPGLNGLMRLLKDPLGEAVRRMEAKATGPNLVANLPLDKYDTWQRGESKNARFSCRAGTFGVEKDMVWSEGVEEGCYVIIRNGLREGDWYAIRLRAKGRNPSGFVSFRKDNKRKAFEIMPGMPLTAVGKPSSDGWETLAACIRIPEGMNGFDLTFTAKEEAGERAWFKNLEIVKLHTAGEDK